MKLWMPIVFLGVLCAVGAFVSEAPVLQVAWIYGAANFLCLGLACRLGWPGIWLKRPDGTLNPLSYVLLLPLHILNALSLLLGKAILKEAVAHSVAPNVWLGRKLTSLEAGALFGNAAPAVLDLTSEFPETQPLRAGQYLCLPVLDHSAPTQAQLHAGVDFISNSSQNSVVYVHCALGHGRSATVVAAWLLRNDPDLTIEAAIQRLKDIRFGVRLGCEQRKALECFCKRTEKGSVTKDIFDIVNERDEVIGRAPRSEVHARGLLHRAVHVLVFNAEGEMFLQKRSKTKDREPSRWGAACSGHVVSGEDYDTAAVREMGEELGWKPAAPLQRILRIEACRETDQEFVWVYRCNGEGPFTLNVDEVETGGWFSFPQIEQWLAERPQDFTTAFTALWRLLCGKI
jgi:isopentenyl-diphosphate delta-isomerase